MLMVANYLRHRNRTDLQRKERSCEVNVADEMKRIGVQGLGVIITIIKWKREERRRQESMGVNQKQTVQSSPGKRGNQVIFAVKNQKLKRNQEQMPLQKEKKNSSSLV